MRRGELFVNGGSGASKTQRTTKSREYSSSHQPEPRQRFAFNSNCFELRLDKNCSKSINSGETFMFPLRWLLLLTAAVGGILLLVWCIRKRSLLVQFLVLLAMGVSMSFLLLMIVQLPEYRSWLATLLVLVVFLASPIAVRLFLRGLSTDESERANEVHKSP